MKWLILLKIYLVCLVIPINTQNRRRLGKFEEVFAWKQLSYNIEGDTILQDKYSVDTTGNGGDKNKIYDSKIYFNDDNQDDRDWNQNEAGRYFVQYNNLPMGVERVGRRLFITVPRRRYGIPSTLNYIDLGGHRGARSPPLSPYPDERRARSLVSVYRTRADECGRLWIVDTGAIEIPNNTQQIQPPAIVVFDLNTDTQILRYQFKNTDIPSAITPTGLASISVLVKNGDCTDSYAFVPDVVTYGVIVFSLKAKDSWRHSHNYFNFNPTAGNLRVAGQDFQWNDGVFSIAIGAQDSDGCATAYFHPMVSREEFSVSTCALENKVTNKTAFTIVGNRGQNSQSTMHGIHIPSSVIFFAEMGRNAISCWNMERPLSPDNMAVLTQDSERLSYPSDLHVTGEEVWVMSNKLPRFIYSRLDTTQYNFFIYRANVRDLIADTVCGRASSKSPFLS